jgi:hypothetical protein
MDAKNDGILVDFSIFITKHWLYVDFEHIKPKSRWYSYN